MRWLILATSVSMSAIFIITSPAWAQSCTQELALLYHDCILGCSSVDPEEPTLKYLCLMGCDLSEDFAPCAADTAGRPGGLYYHALLRGIVEKCNCGQGGVSKKQAGRCVAWLTQLATALKAVKYFTLLDNGFLPNAKAAIKSARHLCQKRLTTGGPTR